MTAIKTTLALLAIVTLSSALGRQALGQSETVCPQCRINFGLAGITRVQTMRVNLVEVGDVPPRPCRQVEIMFLNSRGTPLGRSVDCVGSGQPVFLDLNGASIDGSTNRTEVRVAVRLQPPPEADRDQSNVVATVEVIDNQTGKTVVMVPAVQNQPPNDFAVAVSPSSVSLTAGSSGASTVLTAVTSGAAQSLSLSASGLPAGAAASFSPGSISSGSSSSLNISTGPGTPAGNYLITITATGTSATHTTAPSLLVNLPPTGS